MDRPFLIRDKIKVNLDADRSGKIVLEVKGLSKSFDERVLFEPFDLTILYGERVGIVGANGSGKTTLLKTMMELIPADSGSVKIGASVVVGYYAQEQETLPFDSTPLDFVRRIKPMNDHTGWPSFVGPAHNCNSRIVTLARSNVWLQQTGIPDSLFEISNALGCRLRARAAPVYQPGSVRDNANGLMSLGQ